ncbi:MAG: universal stress protein [Proteobacteria bacterium]|nr:universal stress protein [Pseudomonadota bacterium]
MNAVITHKHLRQSGPILVPTDFTSHSRAALVFAAEVAQRMKHPITLLHVVHDPETAPGFYASENGNRTMDEVAEDMMNKFVADVRAEHPHVAALENLTTMLVPGIPSKRILEVAEKLETFMIIMGSHGRRGIKAWLIGSKSLKIVQRAKIPVTIVKGPEVTALMEGDARD